MFFWLVLSSLKTCLFFSCNTVSLLVVDVILFCASQVLLFQNILSNEHNRLWLTQSARKFFADLLRHAKKDPVPFFKAYDEMTNFLNDSNNLELVETELKQRKVCHCILFIHLINSKLAKFFSIFVRPI